ncbi:hypothetical protein B0H10DRAFT_2120486 [Mycena sp. CBHHK59/15]|nr:hypothetical protein B0H10DRAFT_2120486 [Mycena sp. CBHHK59/15]
MLNLFAGCAPNCWDGGEWSSTPSCPCAPSEPLRWPGSQRDIVLTIVSVPSIYTATLHEIHVVRTTTSSEFPT